MKMPDVIPQKRVVSPAVVDHVTVAFLDCRERRVKVQRHFLSVSDDDVVRQKLIQSFPESIDRNRRLGLKAGDLPERVHSRIRPTGGKYAGVEAGQHLNCLFDGHLDGRTIWLNLPAHVVRSIVRNRQSNIPHVSLSSVKPQRGRLNNRMGSAHPVTFDSGLTDQRQHSGCGGED